MDFQKFSVVIKVRDLALCRVFYRDILGLGSPLIDSNFWVEFRLGEGRTLCLDAALPEEKQPVINSPWTLWMIQLDNIDEFRSRMEASGYNATPEPREVFGMTLQMYQDPEGNPFYVASEIISDDKSDNIDIQE